MPRDQVTCRGGAGISNGYLTIGRGMPGDMSSRGYPSSGRGKESLRGQSSSGRGVGYGVNIRGHSTSTREVGGDLNITEHHAPGRGVGGAVSFTGYPTSGIGGDVSIRGRTASGRGDVSSRGYPASRRGVGGNLNFRSHYAAGRGVESDISSRGRPASGRDAVSSRGHPASGRGAVSSRGYPASGRGAVSSRGHPTFVRGAVSSRGHPPSVRGAVSSRGHPASGRGAVSSRGHPARGAVRSRGRSASGSGAVSSRGHPASVRGVVSSRGHPASVRGAVSSRGHPASVRGALSSRVYPASGRGAASSRGHPASVRGAVSSRGHPASGIGTVNFRGHPASGIGTVSSRGHPASGIGTVSSRGHLASVRGAVSSRGHPASVRGAVSSRGYPSSGSGAVSSRGLPASGSGTVRSRGHHASSRGQSAPGKSVVGDMSSIGHPAHNVSGRGMNSSAHNGMLRAQVESRGYNRIVRGDRKSRGPYGMLRGRGRRQMVSGMSTVRHGGQGAMMSTVGQGGNLSTEGQEEIMSAVGQGHMRSTAAQGDMIFAEGPGGTMSTVGQRGIISTVGQGDTESTLGQRGMMYALGPGDIEMSGVKVTNEESIENSTEELEYGRDIGIIEESMAMGCTGINEESNVHATDSDHLRGSRINIVHLNDTIEVSDDESDAVQENMPDETFSLTNVSPVETVGADCDHDSNANVIKSNLVTINQSEVDLDSVEFIIELDQNFNTEVMNSSIQQPENLLRNEENKSSAVLLKSSSKPARFESSRNKSMYVTCYPDIKETEEILDSSQQHVEEYPCDQCNWILISPKQLKKHQQAMHKIKTTYNPNTEVNSSLLDDQNEYEKTENQEAVDIEENEISSPLIDTEAVAKCVRSNLLRTNMPMTEFAASVLGLSQWTVLILLNNPKPWTQLSREEQSCYETMKLWIDARATDRVDSSENVVDLIKDVDKLPKFNRAFVKMVPLNLSKYGIELDDYM